tara:strand:- start:33 stop:1187 length:1155 start_codon:yes stop_codon:yes gene_type:complete
MGGGYMNPMGYAKGGYRKGLSSVLYRTGLNRDKQIAQEELEKNAEKIAKENKYRSLLGKIGSFLGTAAGAVLAAPTGGVSVLAGKAIGSAVGKGAGDLIGGSFVDTENLKESSTGLYKDDFEYLKNQGIKAQDLGELGKRSAISGATTYGLGKAGEIVEGTKFDFSDAKFKDYFTDTARTTGIGGDKLAENITKQALLDNPELREEFLGGGLDLVDMPESSFLDTLKEISGETISEYKQRTGSVEGYFMNQGGYVQGYEDGGRVSGATPYSANITPEGLFQQILSVPASEVGEGKGLRYYLGEAMRPQMSLSKLVSGNRAINKMVTAPQDSIPIEMLKNYFLQEEPQPEKRGLRGLFGMSKGGKVEGYNQGGLIDMKQFGRRIL